MRSKESSFPEKNPSGNLTDDILHWPKRILHTGALSHLWPRELWLIIFMTSCISQYWVCVHS